MINEQFDDIRPFYESEIPAAMQRIANSTSFSLLASYVYPQADLEAIRQQIRSYHTIRDFQLEVMRCVNEQVIARSTKGFTYCGLDRLDPKQQYMFVSNHRDIMLDACLLQYALYQQGHETSEITFGANLMQGQLVTDIGRANKMFRVERPGMSPREFYKSSLRLSEYMRYTITEKKQSIWIAQRNGRTKDGCDRTDQGIIKMFGMSYPNDKIKALEELHIVPVSISYEWEPCDILKAIEVYQSRREKYIKKPNEDLNSIITGIMQPKGRVHIAFCEPLTHTDLMTFNQFTASEYHRQVAHLLDQRICAAYSLSPNNYIAHDLRYGKTEFSDHYTLEEKVAFEQHLQNLNEYAEFCDMEQLTDMFLGIYANPIDSKSQLL